MKAKYSSAFSPCPLQRLTTKASLPSLLVSACLIQANGEKSDRALTSIENGIPVISSPFLPAPVDSA